MLSGLHGITHICGHDKTWNDFPLMYDERDPLAVAIETCTSDAGLSFLRFQAPLAG